MENQNKRHRLDGMSNTTVFFRKGKRATVVPVWRTTKDGGAVRGYLIVEDDSVHINMKEAFQSAREFLRKKEYPK